MDKHLDGKSFDNIQARIDELKRLFPEAVKEGRFDPELLVGLLEEKDETYGLNEERYDFTWKGKAEALRLAQRRSDGTLRPCFEESRDWDTTQNLYIEGDNLEVMKLLQQGYLRSIKMIYIDPPYNTGNDFVYQDDFADPIAKYKEATGQGMRANPETAGRYHSNWLSMMYPRLRIAKTLLRDDGVIFISVDDGEQANCKKLCDDAFGEENYVGTIIWDNATDNNPTQIATEHEYIICYARRKEKAEAVWKTKVSAVKDILLKIGVDLCARYNNDADLQVAYSEWHRKNKAYLWPLDRYKYIDRGGVYTGSQSVHNPGTDGYRYDITHPVTGQPCKQPLLGYRFPESTMQELLDKGKILFGENHEKIVELKVYAADYEEKLSSVFQLDGRLGSYDLKSYFGEKAIFTNPKPTQLLKRLLSFVTGKNDTILDFFSGSGTVAQAIMELNIQDCSTRKYICVQLPENLDVLHSVSSLKAKAILKNAIAFLDSVDKPHSLAEIAKERIRRAGDKLYTEWESKHSNNKNSLFSDGAVSVPKPDIGFRIFKLDSSNLITWDGSYAALENSDLFLERVEHSLNNMKLDRRDIDMVYEVFLKYGVPLTEKLSTMQIQGKTFYVAGDTGYLMISLDKGITVETIEETIKTHTPGTIIFADECFVDDSEITNAALVLEKAQIEFRWI